MAETKTIPVKIIYQEPEQRREPTPINLIVKEPERKTEPIKLNIIRS